MVKCPKCGFGNREGVKFCEECGSKLESLCPSCGARVPLGRKFCGECGQRIADVPAPGLTDFYSPRKHTPTNPTDKILETREALEGERKLVTVLFADVADFTALSERLDPEAIRRIMDDCFKLFIGEIHRYDGYVDKFTGDGAMALFGAPLSHEDHAQRACYAALALQRALEKYGERIREEFGIDFRMRVGLNSGVVVVGSVGNDLKMDYTAIGDTVNLASRIENVAKAGTVLVSENTHRLARDYFHFSSLGKAQVKGKEKSVDVYELTGCTEVATRIQASVAKGLSRFVGREREITVLEEAFEKARSGLGQVVGIVGEAGVGKSRLLLELMRLLPEREYTFLEGKCLHYGSFMPYLPFLDILRSYVQIVEGDGGAIARQKILDKVSQLDTDLREVLAPLEDILTLEVTDEDYLTLDPQTKRTRIFEAIRDLLFWESQNKPLVLAVEDLHWIDKTSEEFLGYLIGFLAKARILLVLLYRPEYVHQWASRSYYTQIGLGQLSKKASAELVQAILQEGQAVTELRELILDKAAGNPLFMEELTCALLQNGSIGRKDDQYVLTCRTSDIQVPDTIQEIISTRMDRLEENLKRTMQVASVIGRDFAFRILQTITGMREELKSYLMNLQGLEFIYEKRLLPELEYIFKHALTQEVAYNTLLLRRRKEIHERIGNAIEGLYPDRLGEFYEVLTYHYSRSDNHEKACRYSRLSAEKALRSYANWEAFRFYKEAMRSLDKLPDTEQNRKVKIKVCLAIDSPIRLLSYPEDSFTILENGEKLARDLGDERSLASLCSSMAFYYTLHGKPAQALECVEKAFESAKQLQDPGLTAILAFDLCAAYNMAGQCRKLVETASQAIDLVERTGSQSKLPTGAFNLDYYSALYSYCGEALAFQGDFGEGRRMCDKGLRLACEKDDRYSMALSHVMYGYLCLLEGDWSGSVMHFENSIRFQQEIGALVILGISRSALGLAHAYAGNLEMAQNEMRNAIRLSEEYGLTFSSAQYALYEGMMHLHSGNFETARECAERSCDLARRTGQPINEAISMIVLGSALGRADKGCFVEAVGTLLQGIKMCDELNLRPYSAQGHLYLAELYASAGRMDRSAESLTKAQRMFQEMGTEYWVARAERVRDGLPSMIAPNAMSRLSAEVTEKHTASSSPNRQHGVW